MAADGMLRVGEIGGIDHNVHFDFPITSMIMETYRE